MRLRSALQDGLARLGYTWLPSHANFVAVEVGDADQHEQSLLADDPRFGPQILIVDPWALLLPRSPYSRPRSSACSARGPAALSKQSSKPALFDRLSMVASSVMPLSITRHIGSAARDRSARASW